VAKFSADGGSLIYATFIGGTGGVGFTEAYAIAVSGRNAYITGVADTSHFPTTEHAFQRDTPDGGGHPFVSELTRNGVSFVFSTYVASAARQKCSRGDVGVDWGTGIDVAVGTSEVWVTGITCSEHFPVAFQFQSSDEVSYPAGFLFELSPGGRQLLLSTYLGALDGFTQSNAIALNHHFPTENAFQPHRHGFSDAFVMKFRLPGRFASLAYSTFLGGDNGDEGRSIKVDGAGHAYVIGNFASLNFPITQVPSSTSYSVPGVFIAKFSQDGSSLLYCDALGNGFDQSGDSIDLFDGFAYVTGFTDSRDFPVVDAFQDSAQGGRDAFVSKISKDGTSLIYSTYLGGSGDDQGRGIAVGPGGDAFVTGITKSGNFPTQDPFQSLPGGAGKYKRLRHEVAPGAVDDGGFDSDCGAVMRAFSLRENHRMERIGKVKSKGADSCPISPSPSSPYTPSFWRLSWRELSWCAWRADAESACAIWSARAEADVRRSRCRGRAQGRLGL
jgi:hypothetical protein